MQAPDALRIVHLVTAVVLGVFIYLPWADDSTIIWITRLAVYPILTLTGAALWIGRVKAMERAQARRAAS